MGFVNKGTGTFDSHQWNWPEVTPAVEVKKAVHIETADDVSRKRLGTSENALTRSPYTPPEQKGGSQSQLRYGNIYGQPLPGGIAVPTIKYDNLYLCEANMVMYINSLQLGMFDTNNPVFKNIIDKIPNLSDEQLGTIYDNILSDYNANKFDPPTLSLTDGNSQSYEHDFATIKNMQTPQSIPTRQEFVELYRKSSASSLVNDRFQKKGMI